MALSGKTRASIVFITTRHGRSAYIPTTYVQLIVSDIFDVFDL